MTIRVSLHQRSLMTRIILGGNLACNAWKWALGFRGLGGKVSESWAISDRFRHEALPRQNAKGKLLGSCEHPDPREDLKNRSANLGPKLLKVLDPPGGLGIHCPRHDLDRRKPILSALEFETLKTCNNPI